MQIFGQIGFTKGSPQIRQINTFVLTFFSILSTGQTAALAHTRNGSNDVFPHKEVPLGVRMTGDAILGKYA